MLLMPVCTFVNFFAIQSYWIIKGKIKLLVSFQSILESNKISFCFKQKGT